MTHTITPMPHGADCSCGRKFSIWAMRTYSAALDAQKLKNLARANARRHADAANRREAARVSRPVDTGDFR